MLIFYVRTAAGTGAQDDTALAKIKEQVHCVCYIARFLSFSCYCIVSDCLQQVELSALRRDLKVSQRETEDAQEFAQSLGKERDAVKMELQLTDERLMTVSKELAEKGNVVSMLASQVQVRCALRSWVWKRCQGPCICCHQCMMHVTTVNQWLL